jgi:hypothetical protein
LTAVIQKVAYPLLPGQKLCFSTFYDILIVKDSPLARYLKMNKFYLLLFFVNFAHINRPELSPGEAIYQAMDAMYKREDARLRAMLEQLGTKTFTQDELGHALIDAAHFSDAAVVRAFINAGANVNYVDTYQGKNTPLLQAAQCGNTEIAKELINAGADLEHIDVFGQTALWCAAECNKTETAQELIKAKANVNYIDQFGRTVLSVAVQNNNTAIARALIQAGATITSDIVDEVQENGTKKMQALFKPYYK